MPYKNKLDRTAFDRRRREAILKVVNDWFLSRPCIDCGNSDRRVLEADHVRGKKLFSIGSPGQRTIQQVLEELRKCESRCANCHKIRHFEEKNMSKKDGTAAAMNHPPADKGSYTKDQPHARNYPGKKTPKGAKVVEGGSHNDKELQAGRGNSMGASASGSHKGLPPNKARDYVGHDGYDTSKEDALGKPRDVAASAKHDAAELAAGRTNSMGTSADGSHKGLPVEYPVIRQNGGR